MRHALAVALMLALSGRIVPEARAATIFHAVSTNDRAGVAQALAKGADPNEVYAGATPLHIAAEWGYREIAELLLQNEAKVDAIDSTRKTPLLWAVTNGHEEIARILLTAKADPNWHDPLGDSPLSEAANGDQVGLVKYLLREGGAKLSAGDVKPLRAAIDRRNAELVRLLLEAGADPCGKSEKDIGLYHAAAVYGSVEILKIMAEYVGKCPDKAVLADGLAGAAENGLLPVLEYLLSVKPPREKLVTALKEAFRDRQIEAVKLLIANGTDLTAEDKGQFLADAVEAGELPLLQNLIDRGAALDTPNEAGRTALLQACFDGKVETAKFLIERKAAVDTPDSWGATPMLAACRSGSVATVELLLKSGASLRAIDDQERGAFLNAALRGHADVCAVLARHGADINAVDATTGFTALHFAAENDDVPLAKALVSLGVKRSAKDLQNRTARELAEEVGTMEIYDLLAPSPAKLPKTNGRR